MIDTHMHLDSVKNEKKVVLEMEKNGLEKIVTIGTTVEDSEKNVEFAKKYKDVYATVGIYPEYAVGTTDDDLKQIEKLAQNEKVVAIGEIGLDYHEDGFDKVAEEKIFVRQLEIADRLNLPFCIHTRGATEDTYKILSSHKHLIRNGGIMHCYSCGKNWYQKFLDLGLYLSFSGNITFKKNDRSFLKDIPLDRILVETDSPYLSPEPVRGTMNEPKNVRFVIQKIADEIGLSFEELEKITSDNAKRVYKIKD